MSRSHLDGTNDFGLALPQADFIQSAGPVTMITLTDTRETKKAMPRRHSLTVLYAMTMVGLLGCQSGPRWAWWRDSGAPPTDTSLVARAAVETANTPASGAEPAAVVGADSSKLASGPVVPSVVVPSVVVPSAVEKTGLPSAQATPQTIAARVGSAQSPPAAVVTASAVQDGRPTLVPPGSADTVSQAPIASYTPPGTPPPLASPDAALSASSVASVAAPKSAAPRSSGPYDPAMYEASRSPGVAVASSGPTRYSGVAQKDRYATSGGPAVGVADRYAVSPASGVAPKASALQQVSQANVDATGSPLVTVPAARPAPSGQITAGPSNEGPASGAYPANSVGSRYAAVPPAMSPAAVPSGPPAAVVGQSVPVQAGNVATAPFAQTDQATEAIPQAVPQLSSVAAAKTTKPISQYRPGGTSNYSSQEVELARRSAPAGRVGGSQAEGGKTPSTLVPGYTPEIPASGSATRTY